MEQEAGWRWLMLTWLTLTSSVWTDSNWIAGQQHHCVRVVDLTRRGDVCQLHILLMEFNTLVCVGELLHINMAHLAHLILLRLIIPSMALFSPTGSLVDSIFGLFRADLAKPMMIYQRDVPVMVALWLYLHSLGRTTFVTQLLEVTELLKVCGMLTIHSGTVKDVGVPVLAVTSTTHRSSASNYLSRQQMTLSLGFVKTVNQYMRWLTIWNFRNICALNRQNFRAR